MYEKHETLRKYVANLDLTVEWYNKVRTTVPGSGVPADRRSVGWPRHQTETGRGRPELDVGHGVGVHPADARPGARPWEAGAEGQGQRGDHEEDHAGVEQAAALRAQGAEEGESSGPGRQAGQAPQEIRRDHGGWGEDTLSYKGKRDDILHCSMEKTGLVDRIIWWWRR